VEGGGGRGADATRFFTHALYQSDPEEIYNIGMCFDCGDGVKQDRKKAIAETSVHQSKAMIDLGMIRRSSFIFLKFEV